jgi:hypothetical protein
MGNLSRGSEEAVGDSNSDPGSDRTHSSGRQSGSPWKPIGSHIPSSPQILEGGLILTDTLSLNKIIPS